MSHLTEDDRYRTSTQFRHWSYTPAALLSLRETTNELAASRVRDAVRRIREARVANSAESSDANGDGDRSRATSAVPDAEGGVDCLTVEEELTLLRFYCRQTAQLSDHLGMPKDVKATAIQYITRFYTTNSLMTYHPTTILKTALFFATKTENHYTSLQKFSTSIGKTSPEDVLASEFLLTQGLRFQFDVRHPFRALEGAVMELIALAANPNLPLLPDNKKTGEETAGSKPHDMSNRVKIAHSKASAYLKTSALFTDAYFHFTPSQIMLSSLLLADRPLTTYYLGLKIPRSSPLHQKILSTLERCAEMLQTVDPTSEPGPDEKKVLKLLSKKLEKCRNPEKMDLVALQRVKREGEDATDEKVVKKRKMERERGAKEGDDLFGPEIRKT